MVEIDISMLKFYLNNNNSMPKCSICLKYIHKKNLVLCCSDCQLFIVQTILADKDLIEYVQEERAKRVIEIDKVHSDAVKELDDMLSSIDISNEEKRKEKEKKREEYANEHNKWVSSYHKAIEKIELQDNIDSDSD